MLDIDTATPALTTAATGAPAVGLTRVSVEDDDMPTKLDEAAPR